MHEVTRIVSHLRRSPRTLHASGGVILLGVQLFEMCSLLVFDRRLQTSPYMILLVTIPFAMGLFTRTLQRRLRHNKRSAAAYVGMAWVCAFNTLACSSYAQPDFLPPPSAQGTDLATLPPPAEPALVELCTWLFYAFLAISVCLTMAEVASGTPKGNGWIFGVVFTYMTLLTPVAMHFVMGTAGLGQLYGQVAGIGKAVAYNCIHNSMLSSIGFFLITMRDAKVLSESFVDKAGRMLWTFPSIPLTYAAFLRFNGVLVANIWLAITSVVAGVIITGQKKGWWTSNLSAARRTAKTTPEKGKEKGKWLGIFHRGLVWDPEHVAFKSHDPSPRYSWGVMSLYWVVGAALGQNYYARLLQTPLMPSTSLLAASLQLVTIAWTIYANAFYYASTNSGERPLSIFSSVVMPLMNGLFETFTFFATFDFGAALAPASVFGWKLGPAAYSAAAFTIGFHTFSLYSALIHAVMWGAHILPAEYDVLRTGSPRTRDVSEKLLFRGIIPMSLFWLVLYHFYGDMWTVILCHVYADLLIAVSVHLPPPWALKKLPIAA